eukprot:768989-Pyramimonas_sp.AAC.1
MPSGSSLTDGVDSGAWACSLPRRKIRTRSASRWVPDQPTSSTRGGLPSMALLFCLDKIYTARGLNVTAVHDEDAARMEPVSPGDQ